MDYLNQIAEGGDMKVKKVIIITSTGEISELEREVYSKRYGGKLVIVSTDREGEINLKKVVREIGKGEFVTKKDILSFGQMEKFKKEGWVISVWIVDSRTGRPMYECVHRK